MKSIIFYVTILFIYSPAILQAFSIGCIYEKECEEGEKCFDDNIFGICLKSDEEVDSPNFKISKLMKIKKEADHLFRMGYSWDDPITQCYMSKMIYGLMVNCKDFVKQRELEEKMNIINSIETYDKPRSKVIKINLENLSFPEHVNSILYDLFDKEDVPKLEVEISPDEKSMFIAYEPIDVNESRLAVNLGKYQDFPDPTSDSSLEAILKDKSPLKKINKRDLSTSSLNKSNFDKRLALKISLFTMIGIVCVAGIIGTSLFVHMRRKKTNKDSINNMDKNNQHSSKIIKVQNKRLLHNDSESHVEDDDNAVFEVDETSVNLNRQSSTSSGAGDPVVMNIDVKTGHLILGYMEEHFKNPESFERDWASIASYETENSPLFDLKTHKDCKQRTRSNTNLPYQKSRVKLAESQNDFINASYVFDSNPKQPNYIATISPMASTVEDFWQMIWEQNSVTIVCLDPVNKISRLAEAEACVKYWPQDGTLNLREFDIHLVSEHRSNQNYVVRSLYLRRKGVNETRTITQFHFHGLPEDETLLPQVTGTFLEFRRKVNKSFRAKLSPVVVHSEDGCGMVGVYILLDMILNRIAKGIRELDIIASLEHLRDQRKGLVSTKDQFKFVTTSIAEEVNELIRSSNE